MSEPGDLIGQQVGSYRIVRKLGEGGMGAVFEAVQEQIGRHVAIKVLLAGYAGNAQIAQRFFNEARAVNLIDHPSLVEIFDMGTLPDGTAYIVMELLKGESLTDRIRANPEGLGAAALRIARQIASALTAAHGKQIVHRDLKPDNVFLVPDPEATDGERAKVLDFGIAKMAADLQAGPLKTSTQMLMGTPAYMAPEQCRSSTNVDDKADVYALGVMLFQMLSGRLPFLASDTMELLYAHVHEPPPSLATAVPGASAALVAAVDGMLAKLPAQRPTMAQVATTMAELGGTATGRVVPAGLATAKPATAAPMAVPAARVTTVSQAAGQIAERPQPARKPWLARTLSTLTLLVGLAAAGQGFIREAIRSFRDAQKQDADAAKPKLKPSDDSPAAAAASGSGSGRPFHHSGFAATGRPRCGRFATLLVPTPLAVRDLHCSKTGPMTSLQFDTAAQPADVCGPIKDWADGAGWTIDVDNGLDSSRSIILHQDRERMMMSCTNSGARTSVSIMVSPRT